MVRDISHKSEEKELIGNLKGERTYGGSWMLAEIWQEEKKEVRYRWGKIVLSKDMVTATAKGILGGEGENATEQYMILCNLLDFIV